MNIDSEIKKKRIYIFSCILVLMCTTILLVNSNITYAKIPDDVLLTDGNDADRVLYLSDIPYSKASVGWGTLALDKTQTNTPLILKIKNSSTVIKKGIWAHATSTIEYDISSYKDYDYLMTYYGINGSANNAGNGVKFFVYTSVDGETWTLKTEENPTPMKVTNEAVHITVDIRDANYIRLYAYDNGSNASDHAVWGDAKLVKEGYSENIMIPTEEFDEIIKSRYEPGAIKDDLKLTLLQRNFIDKVGQYTLRSFINADPKNYETLKWFIHNEDALKLWTIGGTPGGTYERSLQVLSNLYHAHKEDLENEHITPDGTRYKDLYLRMMISLSLTHSANIGLWIGGNQYSDAVTRYEIYKDMHLNNKLLSNSMFESYTVEEMRWLMHVNIDDEEIKWFRDYSSRYSDLTQRFGPYTYVKYTMGYSYHRPQYYSAENYAKWDKKYNLSAYNITYQYGKPKLWIVFEEGAVCGGISKTAANVYGVWGIPASVVGQPGHAAYIYYENVGGKGAWRLSYNVAATGWANTEGYSRMPNDWGNLGSGVVTNTGTIKPASYFFLAQEAQNEYEKYEEAEFIMMLANVYRTDRVMLEKIFRDTLAEERIHWEAWLGLVNLYITDDTKTDEDLINLAEEISEVYKYHPLPMYDLTRRIGTKIKSAEYRGRLMIMQNRTLKAAKAATGANSIQYKEVAVVAGALLGEINSEIATFSFSGTNANKIVLSTQLQSTQVNWEYSLDGGTTWNPVHDYYVELSREETASINDKNDIKVHINGLPLNEANIYTIDITKRSFPSSLISVNDEEDRLIGVTRDMEWTLNPAEGWNSFATTNPLFSGNKRVYVRVISAGTQIASDPVYYTFTENNTDDEAWYIQSKNLKVVEVNGTGAGNWNNILDGNVNTYWRSAAGYFPAYVTIQLDQPRYISGLDYIPDKSATNIVGVVYGIAEKINVYVSMDGTNWELAASKDNLGNNVSKKTITFPEPKKANYVKVECESIYPPMDSATKYKTFTISVIKLYENVIVNEAPRADINYNITSATNQNVTAELVNLIRPITVTNNNGEMTHTFTENGEFTFEFVDEDGNKGSATATVTWIDKTAPTLDVTFSTTEKTKEEVVATLNFSKEVTILSTNVQIAENPVDKSKTITFTDNGTIELEFQDKVGNIGKKTITVDWIDNIAPTAELEYSTIHLTKDPVTVKLKPSEPITITNHDSDTYTFTENGEFTFEFVDSVGNQGTATAHVTWIADLPDYTVEYSTTELTNKEVEATITLEEGYTITNNGGSNKYTFTESGSFIFEYVDSNNVSGYIIINVDWIDKTAPTAELQYIKEKDRVIVKVINPSEEITFKDGKDTYEFTENGTYDIIFYDKVGNEGKLTAIIDSIDQGGGEDPDQPTDPDKPDTKPSDPYEPDEPSTPDEPNKPTEPDKPIEPTNPETPNIPNKPKPPVNNKPDNTIDPLKTYHYSLNNVSVMIPGSLLPEEVNLNVKEFAFDENFTGRFGNASEYYNIYFENNASKLVNINANEPFKVNIKITEMKELIGVFLINENNVIELVDYTQNKDTIEVSTKKLGKIVVSYNDIKPISPTKVVSVGRNKRTIYIVSIIAGTTIVMAMGYVFLFGKKFYKKH